MWPGYVRARSGQIARNVVGQIPGWSSLMKGAPLTPPMVNVFVSTPASRYTFVFSNAKCGSVSLGESSNRRVDDLPSKTASDILRRAGILSKPITDDFTRWFLVVVQGPGPRYGHVMALVGQSYVMAIGGNDGKRPLGDVWALDTAAKLYEWRMLDPEGEGPPPCIP